MAGELKSRSRCGRRHLVSFSLRGVPSLYGCSRTSVRALIFYFFAVASLTRYKVYVMRGKPFCPPEYSEAFLLGASSQVVLAMCTYALAEVRHGGKASTPTLLFEASQIRKDLAYRNAGVCYGYPRCEPPKMREVRAWRACSSSGLRALPL